MRIFIEGLEFVGPHGVYDEERREGRRFRVDLAVALQHAAQGRTSDELEDTLDYRALASLVLEVGQGPSVALIERMGELILARLFAEHPGVSQAELTIRKFATGVPGEPECVGVSFTRERALEH